MDLWWTLCVTDLETAVPVHPLMSQMRRLGPTMVGNNWLMCTQTNNKDFDLEPAWWFCTSICLTLVMLVTLARTQTGLLCIEKVMLLQGRSQPVLRVRSLETNQSSGE